jgi:hypothetical protein
MLEPLPATPVIAEVVGVLVDDLVALRRDLHAHPELSWAEERTSDAVVTALEGAGWAVRRPDGGGVLAEIGHSGRLVALRADLDALMTAVASDSGPDLVEILTRGNEGTAAIPGKHGGPARPTRSVFVAVPDHPGELARLFGDAGEIGVNIEDVHIDHDPGRPVGLTELVVERGSAEQLLAALESRGWTTHR